MAPQPSALLSRCDSSAGRASGRAVGPPVGVSARLSGRQQDTCLQLARTRNNPAQSGPQLFTRLDSTRALRPNFARCLFCKFRRRRWSGPLQAHTNHLAPLIGRRAGRASSPRPAQQVAAACLQCHMLGPPGCPPVSLQVDRDSARSLTRASQQAASNSAAAEALRWRRNLLCSPLAKTRLSASCWAAKLSSKSRKGATSALLASK